MKVNLTYILMVTLHFAVVIASGIFLWMGKYLGKRLLMFVTTVENLRSDLAPFKIMAHLAFEESCSRRPELRGVLDAMVSETRKNQAENGRTIG